MTQLHCIHSISILLRDETTAGVFDLASLPDGSFVVSDNQNGRLKRVSDNGEQVTIMHEVERDDQLWRVKYNSEKNQLLVRINRSWWWFSIDGVKLEPLRIPRACGSIEDVVLAPTGDLYLPATGLIYVLRNGEDLAEFSITEYYGAPDCATWFNGKLVLGFHPTGIVAFSSEGVELWRDKSMQILGLIPSPFALYAFNNNRNNTLSILDNQGKVNENFLVNGTRVWSVSLATEGRIAAVDINGCFKFLKGFLLYDVTQPLVFNTGEGAEASLLQKLRDQNEEVEFSRARIMMLGHSGAGKTTTIKRLLNEAVRADEPSTKGIRQIGVSISNERWQPETASAYQLCRAAERAVCRRYESQPNNVCHEKAKLIEESTTKSMDKVKSHSEENTGKTVPSHATILSENDHTNDVSAEEEAPPPYDSELSPNALAHGEQLKLLEYSSVENDASSNTLVIWDFAGQEMFYDIHQCFLTNSRTTYVIATDASQPLEAEVKTRQDFPGFEGKLSYYQTESYGDFIVFWLQMIAFNNRLGNSETQPDIVILGTHAASIHKYKGGGSNLEHHMDRYTKQLFDLLCRQHLEHLVEADDIIYIENRPGIQHKVFSSKKKATDPARLKHMLSKRNENAKHWKAMIPLNSLQLYKYIVIDNRTDDFVSIEDLQYLATSLQGKKVSKSELNSYLSHFANLGDILYYENIGQYICKKPTIIIELLVKFFADIRKQSSDCKKGFANYIPLHRDASISAFLEQVLEFQGIAIRLDDTFIIPVELPPKDDAKFYETKAKIAIAFKRFLPLSMFSKLLIQILKCVPLNCVLKDESTVAKTFVKLAAPFCLDVHYFIEIEVIHGKSCITICYRSSESNGGVLGSELTKFLDTTIESVALITAPYSNTKYEYWLLGRSDGECLHKKTVNDFNIHTVSDTVLCEVCSNEVSFNEHKVWSEVLHKVRPKVDEISKTGTDLRECVDTRLKPHNAVGLFLFSDGRTWQNGTVFLAKYLDGFYLLTAAHNVCLAVTDEGQKLMKNFQVQFGYDGEEDVVKYYRKHFEDSRFKLHSKYIDPVSRFDIACCKLNDEELTESYFPFDQASFFKIETTNDTDKVFSKSSFILGYPNNKAKFRPNAPRCPLFKQCAVAVRNDLTLTEGLWWHKEETGEGMSGGPLYCEDASGYIALGVHVGKKALDTGARAKKTVAVAFTEEVLINLGIINRTV